MILLPLLVFLAQAAPESAGAIMARVAQNQDRAQQMRTAFVYHQDVLLRLHRNNGKLAREEYSEFTVTPSATGIKKERTLFKGKLIDKGKVVEFNEPGWEHKGVDIDAQLGKELLDELTNDEKSKDGIPHEVFPLTTKEQRKYRFRLDGTEDYRGNLVYRILFEPVRRAAWDEDSDEPIWAGEVLVDQEEYQPALITTRMAARIPLWVRAVFGTDVQQLGFKVTYQKFDEGLWFPVTYGGEFKFRGLFFYGRRVGISLRNSGFQRADVQSKVEFGPVQ